MSKPSVEVRTRWNKKNYDMVSCRLPKELVQEFRERCAEQGDSQASVIRQAIEEYLKAK